MTEQKNTLADTVGYYVDVNSVVCSTEVAPAGCHFEYEVHPTFNEVHIIVTATGEYDESYVLWPSLDALKEAGVDISNYASEKTSHVRDIPHH